jgi:hypothetical protein
VKVGKELRAWGPGKALNLLICDEPSVRDGEEARFVHLSTYFGFPRNEVFIGFRDAPNPVLFGPGTGWHYGRYQARLARLYVELRESGLDDQAAIVRIACELDSDEETAKGVIAKALHEQLEQVAWRHSRTQGLADHAQRAGLSVAELRSALKILIDDMTQRTTAAMVWNGLEKMARVDQWPEGGSEGLEEMRRSALKDSEPWFYIAADQNMQRTAKHRAKYWRVAHPGGKPPEAFECRHCGTSVETKKVLNHECEVAMNAVEESEERVIAHIDRAEDRLTNLLERIDGTLTGLLIRYPELEGDVDRARRTIWPDNELRLAA